VIVPVNTAFAFIINGESAFAGRMQVQRMWKLLITTEKGASWTFTLIPIAWLILVQVWFGVTHPFNSDHGFFEAMKINNINYQRRS
jgi:hypothetical protein